ncbi:MAG: hypothetical protein KDI79_05060 [Anaerolineae bacterium]|nr:hypothetical protein [Anaerolineae bacterium]
MKELKLDFVKLEDKLAKELSELKKVSDSLDHPEQKSGMTDILFGNCR